MSDSIQKRSINLVVAELLECRRLLTAGDLDLSFSGDGRTTLNFPGETLLAEDVAIQYPDGKTVVVGMKGDNAAAARFNVDGTLDTSFGDSGVYEWPRIALTNVRAVAIQGDGKIVVAGQAHHYPVGGDPEDRFAVARLETNGFPDTSFGNENFYGVSHTDIEANDQANDVAIQRDGKIVAVGSSLIGVIFEDDDFVIARYNANGLLDNGFANGGVKEIDFGDSEWANSVAIDYSGNPDTNPRYGMIVVAGTTADGGTSRFAVARLTTNGAGDGTFDGDGLLATAFPGAGSANGNSVTVQSNGKIVVAGSVYSSSSYYDFGLVRYSVNGVVDTSFGPNGNGRVQTDLGYIELALDVTTGFNGGLLVTGPRQVPEPILHQGIAIVAYTSDGLLDTRFSGDGVTTLDVNGQPGAVGIATTGDIIAPIRRVVIAGGADVARYVDVGSLITIGTFQPNMYEQGQQGTSFIVARTQALPWSETIFLGTGGTATPRGTLRDFNAQNITFGDGQTSTTNVIIPAGATFVNVIVTPIDDTRVEGDETITFTVGTTNSYDAGTSGSTTLVVRDNDVVTGPVVNSSSFIYDAGPPQRARFTFNQDVAGSIAAGDFTVTGPSGAVPFSLTYDNITNTATLSFSGILPDGNYTARAIASGITNSSGTPMAADAVLAFFFLNGDANHDRSVNISDLGVLATNWQTTGKTFSQADFSYDGVVDISDLGILATNWQKTLAAPTQPASPQISPPTSPIRATFAAATPANNTRRLLLDDDNSNVSGVFATKDFRFP